MDKISFDPDKKTAKAESSLRHPLEKVVNSLLVQAEANLVQVDPVEVDPVGLMGRASVPIRLPLHKPCVKKTEAASVSLAPPPHLSKR